MERVPVECRVRRERTVIVDENLGPLLIAGMMIAYWIGVRQSGVKIRTRSLPPTTGGPLAPAQQATLASPRKTAEQRLHELKSKYGDSNPLAWTQWQAEQGSAGQMVELGRAYENGSDVPRDLVTAYMWYDLSAARGDDGGRVLRDGLERLRSRVRPIAREQADANTCADADRLSA
jgi:TPR repeat protein